MDRPSQHPPAANRVFEMELHRRLSAGEEDASRDALHYYLPRLVRVLQDRFQRPQDRDAVEDFAWNSLCRYVTEPWRYRPGSKSVLSFLIMDADGDLRTELKRRHPLHESELPPGTELVAEDPAERKRWMEVLGEVEGLDPAVTLEEIWARVETVLPDPTDRQFLEVWLSGETGYWAFVPVLGLDGRTCEEQQREVKLVRDRIQKSLRRIGKAFDHD